MFQQRRALDRNDVQWDASITIGDSLCLSGQVLDWSTHGVFFRPEVAIDSDIFVEGSAILDRLDNFDNATLQILDSRGKPVVHMNVRLRWIGTSQQHGCRGIGVQNTSVLSAFAQRKAA